MFSIFKKIVIFIILNLTVIEIHTDQTYLTNYGLDNLDKINKTCKIPNYEFSKYEVSNQAGIIYRHLEPGDYCPTYSKLKTICERSYKIIPFSVHTSVCLNGTWKLPLTKCLLSCPRLMSTTSTNVICEYNGSLLENCPNPVEGTTAKISCNPLYNGNKLKETTIHLCNKGKWNPAIPQCNPVCGVKRPLAVLNIVKGAETQSGDYPWHVGIYNEKKDLICGGSIIERNIVLSAAFCFTYYDGTVKPKEHYFVAAGKYYSKYDHHRDINAQFSQVQNIIVPEKYKSETHKQANDIAVLILTQPFTITPSVQQVCIELKSDIDSPLDNLNGIVTGWGYTEEGKELSSVLRELVIPYIPYQQCYNEVPKRFKSYIMNDKFCGGYINNSKAVCIGDNGGGLVFNNPATQKYFIMGILSIVPATDGLQCDPHQYSVYTSVKYHISFVTAIVNNNTLYENVESPQDDDSNEEFTGNNNYTSDLDDDILRNTLLGCRLPNFPRNGNYSLQNRNNTYQPGEYAPKASILYLSCNSAYKPDPPNLYQYTCFENGQWIPLPAKCSRMCPKLIPSISTNIKCEYNGQLLENCENPIEGTKAVLLCNPFYEESNLQANPIRLCMEGKWNSSIPQCSPMCGNPTTANGNSCSWHVGIYNNAEKFLCGGSIIINTKIILSAAQCFIDYDSKIQPAENYLVAAGKFYRKYEDLRDKNAQYSKILEIHIPEEYQGRIGYNAFNIAILILRDSLSMSTSVQPVCLQLDKNAQNFNISLLNNGFGEVRGWGYVKQTRTFSDVLKKIDILYTPSLKCYKTVPIRLQRLITFDKICGVHSKNETSLCGGDSGGGLVFWNVHVGRYYIKGVASDFTLTDEHQCDLNDYTVYTSVATHIDFIETAVANHL